MNIEELSLSGDILKMLVLLLARSVELWHIQALRLLCCVCRDVNTVNNVSSLQVGAKEKTHLASLDLWSGNIIGKELSRTDVLHSGFKQDHKCNQCLQFCGKTAPSGSICSE